MPAHDFFQMGAAEVGIWRNERKIVIDVLAHIALHARVRWMIL
jgi:hypothetical protein